jgi:hypothetical protein
MPALARWYVKTALLYLLVGTLFGGTILLNKGTPIAGAWQLLAPHIAFMTWGWLLLLTMGVAYWILPRWGHERRRVRLVAATYLCLNAAIWIVALAPWTPSPWPNAVGGLLQAAACILFAIHAWPRVKPSAFVNETST